MSEDIMITEIVRELHETQADNMKLAVQLEFTTLMCEKMAAEISKLSETPKKEIIEEYTYKVYEESKQN